MEDIIVPIGVCLILFVGAPWVILHYVTRWKTATTLTQGDEALLDELYRLARRLDDRMNTVERLVAADHPEFRPLGRPGESAEAPISELDRLVAEKKGAIR
jgi:phage shock protein B